MRALFLSGVILMASSAAHAGVEAVTVQKVMDDKAIIVRGNAEMFLIEKGVGCLSLWRYEGKRVYVNSPGLFLGVGSSLLIPDAGQECRIWNSESLGSAAAASPRTPSRIPPPAAPSQAPGNTVVLIQRALKILGYDVETGGVLTEKTKQAFARYQSSKSEPSTEAGIRVSMLSLAVDVLKKEPTPPDALALSKALYGAATGDSTTAQTSGCAGGHWISSVMADGKLIKLEDGSVWEVDSVDTVDSMLWLPTENILVCNGRLVNTDNGEKVGAKVLK